MRERRERRRALEAEAGQILQGMALADGKLGSMGCGGDTKRAQILSAYHPEKKRRARRDDINPKLRARMEQAIERMIVALDALDAPEEDLEDGSDAEADGADKEPSLGAPELTWEYFNSQEHWSRGGTFEVDAEEDRSDDEPYLGAGDDREFDDGENGIADYDGLIEQVPSHRGPFGERVE